MEDYRPPILNEKELLMRKLYVLLFFVSISLVCCLIIYAASDSPITNKKEFVLQMERIDNFRTRQSELKKNCVDSLSNAIVLFNNNPRFYDRTRQLYIENSMSKIKDQYQLYGNAKNNGGEDKLYKVFYHIYMYYEKYWYNYKKPIYESFVKLDEKKKELKDCRERQ